jgi:putative adhesin
MRTAPLLALTLLCVPCIAQSQDRDGDFRWERRLSAGQTVHARNINGDVTVTPSSSSRVEVVGVRRGRSADRLDVRVSESSDGIIVCVVRVDSDDECDGNGYHHHGDDRGDWGSGSMNLEIKLPSGVQIDATSVSGNVDVDGAEGDVRANSVSGDLRLEHLRASSIEARTVSGEIEASVESLSGGRGPLSFKSVSGDVKLQLPRSLDADLAMSSVSGQLDSDFQLTLGGRTSRRRIEARIGRGGRELDVTTVSGDVRLRMNRDSGER